MDLLVITEMWDNIKDDIHEKNKIIVLKNMLLVLEDHGIVDEEALLELKDYDEYFEEAVKIIYKSYDEDIEEEDEMDVDWFDD